jgi:2-methylcitrate dehydratase PrpD
MSGQHRSSRARLSITAQLAELCLRPVDDIDRVRAALHVLDWAGCAVSGSAAEAGRTLARWAAQQPAGPCRTLNAGMRDLWTAAIVNGGVGNVLEMDDIHRTAILHPGPVVVPAALALAEREGATATALLDAVVRGYEAVIRIGAAVGPNHYKYWHNTATCGPFGAAAAACALLALPARRWVDAFGNAGTQAAGLWQVRHESVMSKQLHNGRAAHAGLLAADLARSGFTGPASILEGPQGFFAAMCPGADPHAVVCEPESRWQIHDTSFKPWPACRHAHAAIDAALALRESVGRSPVRRIAVRTYRDALAFCDRPEPRTPLDAKFSLQHSVAVALADGPPPLAAFEPAAIARPDVAALRALVEVAEAEPYAAAYPAHYGAEVEIELANGTRQAARVPDALGDPENPVDETGIGAKALALMHAGGLDAGRARKLADACLALATGGEVSDLVQALP